MKHLIALLPFALIADGYNTMIGPSRIFKTLPQEEKDRAFEFVKTTINKLYKERMDALEALINGYYKPLLEAETLEVFNQRFEEFKTSAGLAVSPVDENLYVGIASLVETVVGEFGGVLAEDERETERIVLFTSLVTNATNDISDYGSQFAHSRQNKLHLYQMLLTLREAKDDNTEDEVASTEGVQGKYPTSEFPRQDVSPVGISDTDGSIPGAETNKS